ncbi:hypothetical protein CDAR_6391 [Caerostris darwini]|uniref:Uncharacterized protein n=1 Tax=Caerostris darwini TaxID=1538125 RepID=A0AAV4S025_9ARAC|nr:hypothetical protein CDAR_6391 [Caerostris darwini]
MRYGQSGIANRQCVRECAGARISNPDILSSLHRSCSHKHPGTPTKRTAQGKKCRPFEGSTRTHRIDWPGKQHFVFFPSFRIDKHLGATAGMPHLF